MSKYQHFADEIKAADETLSNAALGAAVKVRIAKEDPAPTPYAIHGLPDPTGINLIEPMTRNIAANIIEAGAPGLMIQYIRNATTTVTKITKTGSKTDSSEKILRGAPIGVMVAFMYNDNLLIGYSKYNQATVKNKDGDAVLVKGKPEQIEKLVFTKRDAINTAVLRALTDTVNMASVPFKIAVALPAFLVRTEKYFKNVAVNTDVLSAANDTVGFA